MSDEITQIAQPSPSVEPVRGLFIDGREQPVGQREVFPIRAPGTGKIIAYTVNATDDDVDAAIRSARRAFEDDAWRKMPNRTRAKLVYSLGDVLEKHLDELFELESLNNGRPTRETRAELRKLPDLFRYNENMGCSGMGSTLISHTPRGKQVLHPRYRLFFVDWESARRFGADASESGGSRNGSTAMRS